jgi:hypothetical protein
MKNHTQAEFAVMKFRFMSKLAAWTMFGFFLYIFAITFGIVPEQNLPSVNTILGFLILEIGIMIGYYFGASQSSSALKEKDGKEKKR